MKMASKKEDYLKNEDDLKNSDNLKNEDDLKIKTTSKIMSGGGLSFQAMFAAPNTSKSCIWHSSIANWNYSGSARVGSGRSNSDYKAISASQQSWSFGLAELGNNHSLSQPASLARKIEILRHFLGDFSR